MFFYKVGIYLHAISSLKDSIEHYEENGLNSPDKKVELGHAYWLLGLTHMRFSQLEQAILSIETSIEWYRSAKQYNLLEYPYQQLARIVLGLGDIGKGYMDRCIRTIEDSNAHSIDKLCSLWR